MFFHDIGLGFALLQRKKLLKIAAGQGFVSNYIHLKGVVKGKVQTVTTQAGY